MAVIMRSASRLPVVCDRKKADIGCMLSAHCPRHGRTVLIPTSRIDGIVNGDHHFTVSWRCLCGEQGSTRVPRRRPAAI
jgi:hypothetical protein